MEDQKYKITYKQDKIDCKNMLIKIKLSIDPFGSVMRHTSGRPQVCGSQIYVHHYHSEIMLVIVVRIPSKIFK